jgi:hypothetical protein
LPLPLPFRRAKLLLLRQAMEQLSDPERAVINADIEGSNHAAPRPHG